MRPATTTLLGLIAASALLAGCGTDGDDGPSRATASGGIMTSLETTQGASGDTPADGPATAFPVGTGPSTSQGTGAPLVLTGVRVAEHEGFDRVVLEFSGTGTPGWAVNYVDGATLEGSGEKITLDGDSILDIHASNTTWPAPAYYAGPERLRDGSGGITEVYVVGTFEGHTQVLAGIDGTRTPFRVVTLTHPSRLVIDVAGDLRR